MFCVNIIHAAQIMAGLADGSIDLVVGTHALISDSIVFQNLGFAVVDEQHRWDSLVCKGKA